MGNSNEKSKGELAGSTELRKAYLSKGDKSGVNPVRAKPLPKPGKEE